MYLLNMSDTSLNLIGVVSLFGGDTALAAFHYSLISNSGLYSYAFVSPGLQTVASKIFKRIDNRFASSVSPGQRDDPKPPASDPVIVDANGGPAEAADA